MNTRSATMRIAAALLIGCSAIALSCVPGANAALGAQSGRAENQQGVEVLARGPVHEAFAEPVVFDPTPRTVAPKQPPDPIDETPPDQKPAGASVAWIPGYWSWDGERGDFIWVSGFWRVLPPGRQWVPGYWTEVRGGVQWVSGFWTSAEVRQVEYLPAPPESQEQGPATDPPSPDYVWAPGSWYWQGARYVWRPGYWIQPEPDWIWMPAHYVWAPRGYIFVDGYWDHAIHRRGLLFAPVYFDRVAYTRSGFFWTPNVFVNLNLFTDHLFVWPHHHHYYFGDYYAAHYFDVGIYPWFSFQSSRYGYDPIFAYHSFHHRHDREWADRLQREFRHRRDHEEARPARTHTALTASAEKRGSRDGQETALVASLDKASSKDTALRLEKVSKDEREQMAKQAREARQFAKQRVDLEAKASAKTEGKRSKDGQATKLDFPKSPIASRVKGDEKAAPAAPQAPKRDPEAKPKPRGEGKPQRGRQVEPRRPKSQPNKGEAKPAPKQDEPKPSDRPKSEPKADPKPQPKPDKRKEADKPPAPSEVKPAAPKQARPPAAKDNRPSPPRGDNPPKEPKEQGAWGGNRSGSQSERFAQPVRPREPKVDTPSEPARPKQRRMESPEPKKPREPKVDRGREPRPRRDSTPKTSKPSEPRKEKSKENESKPDKETKPRKEKGEKDKEDEHGRADGARPRNRL